MPRKTANEKQIVVSAGGASAAPVRRKPATKRASRSAEATAVAEVAAEIVGVAEPSTETIAKLAYSYWEARGCQGGSPEEDWLRAEQELGAAAEK